MKQRVLITGAAGTVGTALWKAWGRTGYLHINVDGYQSDCGREFARGDC